MSRRMEAKYARIPCLEKISLLRRTIHGHSMAVWVPRIGAGSAAEPCVWQLLQFIVGPSRSTVGGFERNKRYETAEMSAGIGALWICGKACRHQICDKSGNVVLHAQCVHTQLVLCRRLWETSSETSPWQCAVIRNAPRHNLLTINSRPANQTK